jgi:hypothetical protein
MKVAYCWLLCFAAVWAPMRVNAVGVPDQQQPIINPSAGGVVIGGQSAHRLAQVVTQGVSGYLVEVQLPVGCDSVSERRSASGRSETPTVAT